MCILIFIYVCLNVQSEHHTRGFGDIREALHELLRNFRLMCQSGNTFFPCHYSTDRGRADHIQGVGIGFTV
jgi:hypothetical protein